MSANTNSIQQLYVAYFGRPADKTGLAYWETQVALAGGSTGAVSAAFAASAEYTATFAGLSNDQIVNTIYNNLFHRSPEPDGLIFWSNLLTGGAINISNVVTQIAAGAQGTDSVALAQKVAASVAFTDGLNTTDKILSYNGSAAVTIAKGWLAGIYDVATETAAVLPAALNATIASLPAGGTPGTTYTLTTGIDTITGTSGDDTFNAVDNAGGTASTWSGLDALNGGGGSDTLNVASSVAIAQPAGATVTGIQTAKFSQGGAAIAVTLNTTTGWSGLTNLTVTQAGTGVDTITAAATTNVNNTGSSTGAVYIYGGKDVTVTSAGGAVIIGSGTDVTKASPAGAITLTNTNVAGAAVEVDGGTTVNITETGVTSAGTIIVGANTQATGAVVVNATTSATSDSTNGNITVKGGSSVTVTETAGGTVAAAGTANLSYTLGNVTVNGTAATTSVTVNQSAAAAATTAATAVTGVKSVAGVTAAAGVEGVTAVAGTAYVLGVTGKIGVTNGTVTIADKNAATATTASNTITSVALNNYGVTTIADNALSTLSLTGKGGTVTITNAAAAAATNTTLNLTLNGTSSTVAATTAHPGNAIFDANAEITTLNVITTGAASSISMIAKSSTGFSSSSTAASGITALNISGDQVFTLQTLLGLNALKTIAVTGAAGFNDGQHHVSDLATGTYASSGVSAFAATSPTTFAITTASSGAINITLDPTIQTFVGSTGKTTVTIGAWQDASSVITGGTGANDVLILDGGGSFSTGRNFAGTAAGDGAKITGFEVLGVTNTLFGSVDLAKLSAGFTSIEVGIDGITRSQTAATGDAVTGFTYADYGTNGATNAYESLSFTNVAANTALTFDKGTYGTTTYQLNSAAGAGSANSVTVNLGAATSTNSNFGTLVLQGVNGSVDGIGTVSLVSNGVDITDTATAFVPNHNTVEAITDLGLAHLNVSGTQSLTIGALAPSGSSLSVGNTNTGGLGLTISALTDNSLSALTFTGTGASTVSQLIDTIPNLTLANNGTGTVTVSAINGSTGVATSTLQSLTLTGNVAVTLTDSYAGVTISGATDNAHVELTLTGGGADSVTLGNGNNVISTGAGADTIVAGSGLDLITGGTGADVINGGLGNDVYVYADSTTTDSYATRAAGSFTSTTADSLTVTVGDVIRATGHANFTGAASVAGTAAASANVELRTLGLQTVSLLTGVSPNTAAYATYTTASEGVGDVLVFNDGTNTFLEFVATAQATSASDLIIKVVGIHTFSIAAGSADITVAS